MANKFAGLKGTIPVDEPDITDEALLKLLQEREAKTLDELTREFNGLEDDLALHAVQTARLGLRAKALDILLRKKLAAENADAVTMHGYVWGVNVEPYASVLAKDIPTVEQYFRDHDMLDLLELKTSEIASRLKNFVKDEAENNLLNVEEETVELPGGELTVKRTVTSQIPNVRVFLKPTLSRKKVALKIKKEKA